MAVMLVLLVLTVLFARWVSVDPWRAELLPVLLFGQMTAIAYRQELAILLSGTLSLILGLGLGLGVGEDVLHRPLHPLFLSVSSQLGQKEHRPHGPPVLGRIARAWLDPIAIRVLGLKNSGDSTGLHHVCLRGGHLGIVVSSIQQLAQSQVADAGVGLIRL